MARLTTELITIDDRALEVQGRYYRKQWATLTDPEEPEAFEIYRIKENDKDVTAEFYDRMEEIEDKVLEGINDA
jgi:hypothetical protein